MDPNLIGLQVRRVQKPLFFRVKHHTMDTRVRLVCVILHIFRESARIRVGSEDGAVAGVVVKGVAVDGVGGFVGGEEEDGAGVCVEGCGGGCFYMNMYSYVHEKGLKKKEIGENRDAYGHEAWDERSGG